MELFQKMSLSKENLLGQKKALKLRVMTVDLKMDKLLAVVQSFTKMEVPTLVQ